MSPDSRKLMSRRRLVFRCRRKTKGRWDPRRGAIIGMPSRPLVGKEEIALPSGPAEKGYSYLRGTVKATGISEHHQPTSPMGGFSKVRFLGLATDAAPRSA